MTVDPVVGSWAVPSLSLVGAGRPILATVSVGLLAWHLSAPWARPPCRRPPCADRPGCQHPGCEHPGRQHPGGAAADPARIPAGPRTRPGLTTSARAVASIITVIALALVTALSPVIGIGLSLAAVGAVAHRRRTTRRRIVAERHRALPELVDVLVALIHSGLTPTLGWRQLPVCAPPALDDLVRNVVASLDRGVPFADALGRVLDDLGPSSRGLFDTLVTAERYGLPLVPALDRLSAEAAAERRRAVEAGARQLPVRMAVPLVVCTLPAFTLLGIIPVLAATLSSLGRP